MVGPLPPGKYKTIINQQTQTPTAYQGTSARYFEVTGPRFSLPPFDVHSVYPSRNEQNATTECYVPFITLQRRTLPWDRSPFIGTESYIDYASDTPLGDKNRDYPFMALLVFTETELPEDTNIHKGSGDFTLEDVYDDQNVRITMKIDDIKTTVVDKISPHSINLQKVLPTLDELLLLTHARQVNPMDKENCGDDADGWFSVAISNRILVPDTTYHACLVSIEGKIESLYGESGIMNANENQLGSMGNINLVLLHHWSFKSSPEGGDFQSRMERLQSRLQSSISNTKLEGDLIPINLLKTNPMEYIVNGGGQSGTTLNIDNGEDLIEAGQIFTIDGVAGDYTVVSIDDSDGGSTPTTSGIIVTEITIEPALASSPADNAEITFNDMDLVEPLLLGNESVPGMTLNSYLMTEMFGSDGLTEDVLYRGPFTAFAENHSPKSEPYQDSDGALAMVQELGIWDISHASAFELGRLLALSDARYTKALKRWVGGEIRKQQQQRAKDELNSRELDREVLAEILDPDLLDDFSTTKGPVAYGGGGSNS